MILEFGYKNTLVCIFCILTTFISANSVAAKSVFPGAKGFGSDTRAMYGKSKNPVICIVTNITNSNGTPKNELRNGITVKTGSFKEMLNYNVDNKLIIFEVSGNITIEGRLYVRNNFVTIAGQTAPSPGVTFKGLTLVVQGHDVLIQHIRIRVGDEGGVEPYVRDGLNITAGDGRVPYNIVIDHCSISWAIDENMGIGSRGIHDVTVNNCIIAEGLYNSLHPKGPHSKGMIVATVANLSLIQNLFAHNHDRNPVLQSGNKVAVVNNLIYNPGDFNIRISASKAASVLSIVGNETIAGANTHHTARDYIPCIWGTLYPGTTIYLSDNKSQRDTEGNPDDWSNVRDVSKMESLEYYKATTATVWPSGLAAQNSSTLKDYIVHNAGARPKDRDPVDERIVGDLVNLSGGIINSPSDVGGWPELAENTRNLATMMPAHIGPIPKNPNEDDDRDGYTNLEEWLHKLSAIVERAAPTGLKVNSATAD
jgi:hypothetical protein